jgi:hypothetical protein
LRHWQDQGGSASGKNSRTSIPHNSAQNPFVLVRFYDILRDFHGVDESEFKAMNTRLERMNTNHRANSFFGCDSRTRYHFRSLNLKNRARQLLISLFLSESGLVAILLLF